MVLQDSVDSTRMARRDRDVPEDLDLSGAGVLDREIEKRIRVLVRQKRPRLVIDPHPQGDFPPTPRPGCFEDAVDVIVAIDSAAMLKQRRMMA